ncbi:hypothetical protein M404DRAFT_1004885 [Pisolithus tinctorius Marx 270]|uniref:Uncharacterized protein n=1 Tax=Pisolithus tinctorius Marx 270 TaxID=870435 RepID=A0A0C3JNY7_PISTI|nr:hypothetical protein M404DRAFT_1004885 [Pisolithus tinctorius Marx 270]
MELKDKLPAFAIHVTMQFTTHQGCHTPHGVLSFCIITGGINCPVASIKLFLLSHDHRERVCSPTCPTRSSPLPTPVHRRAMPETYRRTNEVCKR